MATNQQVIANLIAALQNEQLSSGWYASYSLVEGKHKALATPYFSLLVGSLFNDESIFQVDDYPVLYASFQKVQQAIIKQQSSKGTYNYWFRGSKRDKQNHIPDDWDDTALAYASVIDTRFGRDPFAYNLLKTSRTTKGGLFETWILPAPYPEQWQDTDLWVNLNICFWLIREKVLLNDLWEVCVEKIQDETSTSRYYVEPYSAWFFFTRAALRIIAKKGSEMPPALLQATHKALQYIEHTANLALKNEHLLYIEKAWILATLRLLAPESLAVERHAKAVSSTFLQKRPIEPVILGWQRPGKVVHDGSPALTMALFLVAVTPPKKTFAKISPNLSNLPKHLTAVLEYLLKSDFTQEIIQLPGELEVLMGLPISKERKETQQVANLVGWAYFWLDDQEIDRHTIKIPISVTKDETFGVYENMHQKLHRPESAFWKKWSNILDTYHRAATKERSFHFTDVTRPAALPANWDLFYLQKAGPYLLSLESCYTQGVPSKICALYSHYLLAKQYSDDARDCLEDLHEGRRTFCTQRIHEAISKPLSAYTDKELEDLFLAHVSEAVTQKIYDHLEAFEHLSKGHTLPTSLKSRIRALWASTVRHERHQREVEVIQAATRSMGNS